MNNKRRATRAPCYAHVTIQAGGEVFYGMTGDISEGGLFIATFDKMPDEGEIRLSFAIPKDTPELVEAKGRVVWINNKRNPVRGNLPEGFGVEFSSISPEQLAEIRAFIASALPENLHRALAGV
jgi:uncharacterized protein (TIGR02266 family)